jgi:hypothetical protein
VSLYPDDGNDAEVLIKNADVAMNWGTTISSRPGLG